jgi:hypothetical protein
MHENGALRTIAPSLLRKFPSGAADPALSN